MHIRKKFIMDIHKNNLQMDIHKNNLQMDIRKKFIMDMRNIAIILSFTKIYNRYYYI